MRAAGSAAGKVHVVGAGLAGLAAAAALVDAGARVAVYESSQQDGGRCRSYFDAGLGVRIDNGNHLLLSGNLSALTYLRLIGARDTVEGLGEAAFPFVDLASGEHWVLRPNRGALPWWVLCPARRVPGTRTRDYLAALRLRDAGPDATVGECLYPSGLNPSGLDPGGPDPAGVLYRRLWQPLAVAALNTAAEAGSARLFWQVLSETLGRGAAACLPLVPREGLSESFVDPALAMLRAGGAEMHFATRLRALRISGERVAELDFDGGPIDIRAGDLVVLAVPPAVAARLVPGLVVPDDHAPIVNAHYRATLPAKGLADAPLFAGLIGGAAEWVFRKREVLSVTVSAADRLVDRPAEELSGLLWGDVARALHLPAQPIPPSRIVKERRATFRATPEQLRRRPSTTTRWNNFLLAGDYVDTGLPGTIEGAIRSGLAAAEAIARQPGARASFGHADPDSTERSNGTRFGDDEFRRDKSPGAR